MPRHSSRNTTKTFHGKAVVQFHLHYSTGNTFNCAESRFEANRRGPCGRSATPTNVRTTPQAKIAPCRNIITFYAARHSWATIARSAALKIDKYTVHEALNHVDADMKITDRYIDRDWSVIWQANAKVLGLLDWSELKKREENRK